MLAALPKKNNYEAREEKRREIYQGLDTKYTAIHSKDTSDKNSI